MTTSFLLAVTFGTLIQSIVPAMMTTSIQQQQYLQSAYAQEEVGEDNDEDSGNKTPHNNEDDNRICIPEDIDCDGDDDINPPDDDKVCIPEDLDCDGDDDINPPRQPDDDDNNDNGKNNNNNNDDGNSENNNGNDFLTALVRTDDERYKIDADYDVIADGEGKVFDKNEGARDASKLILTSDEDINIQLECSSDDCRTNSYTGVSVYLVDIDEKDKDIGRENADTIEALADHFCGDSNDQEACDFELTIPNNTDSGKYKLVMKASTDELDTFLINKVVMEGNINNN